MRCAPMVVTDPVGRLTSHAAAAAPPSNLDDASALDEYGHARPAAGQRKPAGAGFRIGFDVVLGEVHTIPQEVLPQFGRIRTTARSVQLYGWRARQDATYR